MTHPTIEAIRPALLLGSNAALAIGLCASQSVAAQDRPDFQSPTHCGQVWDVSTYGPPGRNHAPDPDSLDFAMRDGDGRNISRDQPVLASAAGVVRIDRTLGNGLRYIMIDHAGDWRTHYLHVAEEEGQPRLAEGRRVAMGEVIGRTSDTGSSTLHIHYTQVRGVTLDQEGLDEAGFWDKMGDGEAVRAVFDGTPVDTYQADTSSWGRWGDDNAEDIRSHNCPGNRFLSWREGGKRFFLRYRPTNGRIRINRFDTVSGTETTQTLQADWGQGWTSFIDFLPNGSNRRHIMGYNFATGAVGFWEIVPGAATITKLNEVQVYAGWTHMEKLKIADQDHLISYDSRYGHFNVDRINRAFTGFESALKTNLGKGYTQIVPYWEGNDRYLLLYKGSTGAVRIVRLTRSGTEVDATTTWSATRASGWTHMTTLPRGGKMYLFGYRSDTGKAKLWELQAGGSGLTSVRDLNWSSDYSTITPFSQGGAGHLLVQKIGDGTTKTVRLKNDLSGFRTVMNGSWATGWR
ncbi:M23 family metallopeptidase [uncultured Erythrobacter sp.]|uniref:M23 family metallopeptidase n=1 Tax=uncultured Erythrobacter sp. TaxID=263913 RepID=UPI0026091987|nr:M23 family metallopeptidase [uncultured Erythrobacter sp.]